MTDLRGPLLHGQAFERSGSLKRLTPLTDTASVGHRVWRFHACAAIGFGIDGRSCRGRGSVRRKSEAMRLGPKTRVHRRPVRDGIGHRAGFPSDGPDRVEAIVLQI